MSDFKQIPRHIAALALEMAIESPEFKFICYQQDPDFPGDSSETISHSFNKVDYTFQYVNMARYEWRDSTDEEIVQDRISMWSEFSKCMQFQYFVGMNPFSRETSLTGTYIGYDSRIHKSVHDYGYHLELGPTLEEVIAEHDRRELEKSIAYTKTEVIDRGGWL